MSQLSRWGIRFQQVDIRDKKLLEKILIDSDIIYHLAGADVGTTEQDKDIQRDRMIRSVGVEGTKNIIELSPDDCKIIFRWLMSYMKVFKK